MAKFADFESSFLAQFSSVNKLATAEFDIKSLKQKGTVAEYAAAFRALANQTDWNEGAKKAQFRFRLKDQKWRAIAIVPNAPKGYEEYLNWVIEIRDMIDQAVGTVGINASNSGTVGYSSNRNQRFQRNSQGSFRSNTNAATGSNAIGNAWLGGKCFKCGMEGHFANDRKFHPESQSGQSKGSGTQPARYVPPHWANATEARTEEIPNRERGHTISGTRYQTEREVDEENIVLQFNATYVSEEQLEIAEVQEHLDSLPKN